MTAFKLIEEIRVSRGNIIYQDDKIIIETHGSYLSDEMITMLNHEKQTLIKILQIEHLVQQIRTNHQEYFAPELSKLFSAIIKNSCDLVEVIAWLEFIINTSSTLEMITCGGCDHSTSDKMGDRLRKGNCSLGIAWTDELNARFCKQFSKLMS
jgi:hypothetical protein